MKKTEFRAMIRELVKWIEQSTPTAAKLPKELLARAKEAAQAKEKAK